MTTTQAPLAVTPSLDRRKMEERKRSLAVDTDELAPSRKRLVKDENGRAMRMDADKEMDIEVRRPLAKPGGVRPHVLTAENLQNFQKDAIIRQKNEYKRQAERYEAECSDLRNRCKYHDEHLRLIDAWFAQLLDEVRALAAKLLPSPPPSATSHGTPTLITPVT
jgi:E3 ubiquitin-protein ligase BRE1